MFTDVVSTEGGSGLAIYISVGLSSTAIALIVAAVIAISVTVCLRKGKECKQRVDDGMNENELKLKDNNHCSTDNREEPIYDHLAEETVTHDHLPVHANGCSASFKDQVYDHLPTAPPVIHNYATIVIESGSIMTERDSEITTVQNEAYDISMSINKSYGVPHHK